VSLSDVARSWLLEPLYARLDRLEALVATGNEALDQIRADLSDYQTTQTTNFERVEAHLNDLEAQVAAGQPVDPAKFQAVRDQIAQMKTATEALDAPEPA
jgi:ribosomal protein L29